MNEKLKEFKKNIIFSRKLEFIVELFINFLLQFTEKYIKNLFRNSFHRITYFPNIYVGR